MDYVINLLKREKYIINCVLKTWPKNYNLDQRNLRINRIKQLDESIQTLNKINRNGIKSN